MIIYNSKKDQNKNHDDKVYQECVSQLPKLHAATAEPPPTTTSLQWPIFLVLADIPNCQNNSWKMPVNWLTNHVYKTPIFIVKGHPSQSCLFLLSFCFIDSFWFIYAKISIFWKKKNRCHITPLPHHNGHFPSSPSWQLWRGWTVLKAACSIGPVQGY